METVKEQEGNIDYVEYVGTTEDGGLTITHDGITYSTDDEAMIEYDGTIYTMAELNDYEETKKYKPQIVKAIKTAQDAKKVYEYLKMLSRVRINLKVDEPRKRKKLEEIKNPEFFTNKIKSFVNDTEKGISDFTEKNKNSKTAYIIGAISTIFFTYLFYTSFKITYLSSYFYTFLFLLRRLIFFILIITLIILTYALIIRYFPWFTKIFIQYLLLTINPLTDNNVNDSYHYLKQWKVLATIYLIGAHVVNAVITLFLLLFLIFILAPFIIILGYMIGVCLTFMD
jgi:hypothetical protein